MRRGLVAAALACAAASMFAPAQASACTCAEITEDTIGKRNVAIVAKLKRIETLPTDVTQGIPATVHHYRVTEVLKGERRIRKRRIAVYSDTSTCALAGQVGRRYGLLLERRDRRWHGGLCGQTTPRELRAVFDERRERAAPLCTTSV